MIRRTGSDGRPGPRTDRRAVSEVVAFILVFAIILGSVGLLYSTALGGMTDYQETEQQINAERAMESLADNFNDVIRDNGVNKRSGELSLREGTISTSGDGTKLDVTVDGETLGSNPNGRFAGYGDGVTADLGEFAYTSEGARIAYEGGGLVRSDDSGDWSLMREPPKLKCSDDAAIVSLVAISAEDRSIASSSTLGFEMSVENRSSKVYDVGSEVTVSVEGDSAYEAAWNETLDSGGWEWDESDTKGVCDTDRVVVTVVEVDILY